MRKICIILALGFISSIVYGKDFREKFSKPENGHLSQQKLQEIALEAEEAAESLSEDRYVEVVVNPENASDTERLAAMTGREFFVLVDRSMSMLLHDENPTGNRSKKKWTRWDSAREAAESIGEVVLSLDKDNIFKVMLWEGTPLGKLKYDNKEITDINQIRGFFEKHPPKTGTTPMAAALEEVYQNYLKRLLNRVEPFTVIILTDGAPNNQYKVEKFFKKIVKTHNLEQKGREYLAAFSFVRVGDDPGAIRFLKDLDDNLIDKLGIEVDIVDTKTDNFLFGTGKYRQHDNMGPFALLWDAIFD